MTRVVRLSLGIPFMALVVAILLAAVMIREAPAQHGAGLKVTGKVTDKIVAHFGPSGLSGVRSVEYRRLVMAPGARMEGRKVMDDHAQFCVVEKGSVTITTAGGTKHTYRAGDAFVKPKGFTQTVFAADPQQGYVELSWTINLKGH
ncbi:MAG: cupin domain-containing protein [Armatimonadota bacterium]